MRLLKIGRDTSCDIVLYSDKVSSLHAEITLLNSGDILLEDKGSRNGTFIMNQPIKSGKPVNVRRGDAIRFADVELQWNQIPMPEDNSAYKGIYGIGTNFNNEIQISGSTVSRYHATVKQAKDGKMYIVDHSKNGTTVNGTKITPNNPYRIKKKNAVVCGGVPVDLSRLPWPIDIWRTVLTVAASVLALVGISYGIYRMAQPSKYEDSELYAMYNNAVVYLQTSYHYEVTIGDMDMMEAERIFGIPSNFIVSNGKIIPNRILTSQATGFFISNDGKLITNLHVVKPWLYDNAIVNCESIYKKFFALQLSELKKKYETLNGKPLAIYDSYMSQIKIKGVRDKIYLIPQGKYYSNENAILCRVLSAGEDIEKDVALIQSEKGELPPKCRYINVTDSMDVSNEPLIVGKHIYTIGFPRGYDGFLQDGKSERGLQVVASGGSITQAEKEYDFSYNAPTTGGASGSPIFNEQGMLIGVHHAGLSRIETQGYNSGIKAKYIRELLNNPHKE